MVEATELERVVRQLVKEKPDVVYTGVEGRLGCFYTKGSAGGECGCLIGQALRRLSPEDYDKLAKREELGQSLQSVMLLNIVRGNCEWLQHVQHCQDRSFSWSQAVRKADEKRKSFNAGKGGPETGV